MFQENKKVICTSIIMALHHDYNEVIKLEETAKSKGYRSSFIVAFKDGKESPLADALKTTAN